MKLRSLRSLALAALAFGGTLGGCASLQSQTQTVPGGGNAGHRESSWMSPAVSGKNLLYVSAGGSVLVYDYGTSNQVGSLNDFTRAEGECTDSLGDVYVTNYEAADVLEFAHGKTAPIKTLIDPSQYPIDCAVDPGSGNLAVINQYGQSIYSAGDVAIYAGAKGKPKTYKVKGISNFVSGGYDASGNLLVSGYEASALNFAILQHGTTAFKAVSLPHNSQWKRPGYIRWDGEYFDVEFYPYGFSTVFMWYTIKGTKGTREGYMQTEESGESGGPFWLGRIGGPRSVKRANQLVAAMATYGVLGWNYPRGGTYVFQLYNVRGAGVSASAAEQ
jgi:hypothetical protein